MAHVYIPLLNMIRINLPVDLFTEKYPFEEIFTYLVAFHVNPLYRDEHLQLLEIN
jgi:hypothetical protein